MIKLLTRDKDGKPTVVFGISKMNVQKLKEGKPIYVDLQKDMGIDIRFVIIYGKSQDAMERAIMKGMLKGDVKIGEIKRDKPLSLREELIDAAEELIRYVETNAPPSDKSLLDRVKKAVEDIK